MTYCLNCRHINTLLSACSIGVSRFARISKNNFVVKLLLNILVAFLTAVPTKNCDIYNLIAAEYAHELLRCLFIRTIEVCHLLSFYFLGTQRLRRSKTNVERLAPQPAVSSFGCRVRSCGGSWQTLRGRGVGDSSRDDARLHRGRGGRKLEGGFRLVNVAKTDGTLRGQMENQLGKAP